MEIKILSYIKIKVIKKIRHKYKKLNATVFNLKN